MKGSPSWPEEIPGEWKIEFLRWLGNVTGVKTLIETGTCEGVTPYRLRNDFDLILTIELHAGLFESASKRLDRLKNVRQYFGSSRNRLGEMIDDAKTDRILFWLDAHGSGPHTADEGDPLPFELATIMQKCPRALIVVDDLKSDTMQHVIDAGVSLDGWHREYRTGEVIMFKENEYIIPSFED
jgi:hypothetical protein